MASSRETQRHPQPNSTPRELSNDLSHMPPLRRHTLTHTHTHWHLSASIRCVCVYVCVRGDVYMCERVCVYVCYMCCNITDTYFKSFLHRAVIGVFLVVNRWLKIIWLTKPTKYEPKKRAIFLPASKPSSLSHAIFSGDPAVPMTRQPTHIHIWKKSEAKHTGPNRQNRVSLPADFEVLYR